MTIAKINESLTVQTAIHETARQIVELLQAAHKTIDATSEGDADEAVGTILEMVQSACDE